MAYNPIRFRRGMSMPEFLQCFGTEAACAEAVRSARWPEAFACPRCEGRAHGIVVGEGRSPYQCHTCRRQTSLTAGTLFVNTKLRLTRWFLVIYLFSRAKTRPSALEPNRHIGVSYPTAWLMQHKIMTAMASREAQHRLSAAVQIDDAYLGGERPGGKPGRGSENKVLFAAAVSLNDAGNPLCVKVALLPALSSEALSIWAKSNLKPGCTVLSDGLGCFAAVTEAGCTHQIEVVGQRKPRDLPPFKWVNTVLGDVKTILSGAYKSFGHAKYADRYLGAIACRFNCTSDLADLVVRLIGDVCRGKPAPERVIRHV